MSLKTNRPTDAIAEMISNAVVAEVKQHLEKQNLICEKDALKMLGIKDSRTLKEWVKNGLEVYTVGRNRFYFINEIEDFIRGVGGNENAY